MKLTLRVVLVSMLLAAAAWAQQAQVSVDYLYQGSNHVLGATNQFGGNGGRADVSFGNWRHFGLVAEFAGAHSSSLSSSGVGLTTFTYLAGPRRTFQLGGGEKHKVSAFVQVLLGGVHASEGLFPGGTAMKGSANSFALSAGAGLEAGLTRRISLRLIQADYLHTRLPNLYDNYQSNFRLGSGVVFRIH